MTFEYSSGAFVYRKDGDGENAKLLFLFLIKPNNDLDVPKGHVEEGENAETAARREIMEESGIEAEFIPGFMAYTAYYFYRDGKKVLKKVRYFLSKVSSSDVKISYEHKGYEWLEPAAAIRKLHYRNMKELVAKANEYAEKHELMLKLNEEYANLPGKVEKWRLSKSFVPGEGPLDAKVFLLGQAPGLNEDRLGRPFVGRSGKLLDTMILKAGLKRSKVYIASAVQYYPPRNREPTREEIALCRDFVSGQIEIIKPEYVVLMGNTATGSVLGFRGVETRHGEIIERNAVKYLITLHPAAVLRFKKKGKMMEDDFRLLGRLLKKK